MNKEMNYKWLALIYLVLFGYGQSYSQGNKVIFVKEVPIKLKSESSYTFFVGYEVAEDSDIAMEFSGGPSKFWSGSTVPIEKGKGVFQFKLSPKDKPTPGKGYRIVVSVRKLGGNWKTEKASSIIKNIEITKNEEPILDDASFSLLTPTSFSSRETFEFDVNYKASAPRLVQIALWNGQQWIAASKNQEVQPGKGEVKLKITTAQLVEGNAYRYVLYYGSGEGFPNVNIVSKELSGIEITKAIKVLTIDDLKEKSIVLSINKNSEILTIPGDTSYDFIRIIALNGTIMMQEKNTNSINISNLERGGYYAITSKDDYYQFANF